MTALLILLLQTADPGANRADEPFAQSYSLERGWDFLENASLKWQQSRKCVTCHTNMAYLVTASDPALRRPAHAEVRKYFEDLVAERWPAKGPRWDAEVVVVALGLAVSESGSDLQPLTRQALDRMWTVQKPDGGWNWLKCGWPPMESDDYYGATVALLAAGRAPGRYLDTPAAQTGVKKAREWLAKNPAPSLHHRGMLLWASTVVDGLMAEAERKNVVDELLALQRPDGGWSTSSFLPWKRADKKESEVERSDAYGTGFVIHLARLGGVPAADARLAKGIRWLKTQQRESGRWFTRSLNEDGKHYLSHAGTAFALLALHACGESR